MYTLREIERYYILCRGTYSWRVTSKRQNKQICLYLLHLIYYTMSRANMDDVRRSSMCIGVGQRGR